MNSCSGFHSPQGPASFGSEPYVCTAASFTAGIERMSLKGSGVGVHSHPRSLLCLQVSETQDQAEHVAGVALRHVDSHALPQPCRSHHS